uniref:Uncharacterized protein n=1 Tax=Opuntia streptacantha TaxID=393608 RepID=A0A7C9D5L1_OPUST
MKASFTFREERAPLLKAKVALTALGLPFQSAFATGDSDDLCVSFGTFFDSGPAFRVSFRPNDSFNPISLLIKTGIGRFGSPVNAPMKISAEFNLLSGSMSTPTFFLHFKPRLGHFSLRKTHSSDLDAISKRDDDPVSEDGTAVDRAMETINVVARTVLPIQNVAVFKLRWGVNFSEACRSMVGWGRRNRTAGMPLLTLNKIGIEHVLGGDCKEEESAVERQSGSGDLVETCFTVKRQLDKVRVENALLGKALEDIRAEIGHKACGKKN